MPDRDMPTTFLLPLRNKSRLHKWFWRTFHAPLIYKARIAFFDREGKRYKEFYYRDPMVGIEKMILMGDWGVSPDVVTYEEYSRRHGLWLPVQCDELREMML